MVAKANIHPGRIYHIDNIIYLIGKPGNGCIYSEPVKGMMPMVTYSDLFTFVIMICAIVTLVRDFRHKK
ncbi:hypothetical protein FYJ75_09775 [Roseburia sp. MUC/MUC-530-WT-4D]|uniref:Uncharacterized protein n=1 Tax=Roseburia porci TaxID=2605790 RepID=A0A6L5YTK4_9FIRM|nr:hypothetical protein [Roseburia porci]